MRSVSGVRRLEGDSRWLICQYSARVRFYIHGAGRAGREAWPEQSTADAVFADHAARSTMTEKAHEIADQCPAGDVVVVAHSLGAVPAALAYSSGHISASHVVLLEPALYDIARGHEAIEGHIGPMSRARGLARSGDLFGYWQIVGPMMFGRDVTRDSWEEDRDLAQRFADLDAPWGHGIEASTFVEASVLVVTGGWNAEYEAIAEALVDVGATHRRLTGSRHRPQDHPDFEELVGGFVRARS